MRGTCTSCSRPGAPGEGAYHSLIVADFDNDGDADVVSCEMEGIPGDLPPRWFLWENADGKGQRFVEHVILDANLGGHLAVAADVDGDGDLDILGKLWRPRARTTPTAAGITWIFWKTSWSSERPGRALDERTRIREHGRSAGRKPVSERRNAIPAGRLEAWSGGVGGKSSRNGPGIHAQGIFHL